MLTSVYAPKIITQAQEAKPSSPSVKFTPLLAAAINSSTQGTTRMMGKLSSHSMSRRKDTAGEAGVIPRSSGNCNDNTANATATSDWPAVLALLRRPSERCLLILMKSSRNPTTPSPVNKNRINNAEAEGPVQVIKWLAR